jgi:hypothetical protein
MSQNRADVERLVGLRHVQQSAVDMAQPDVGEIRMFAVAGGGRARLDRPGFEPRSTRGLTRRSLLRLGAAASAGTLIGIRPWATASAAAAGGPAVHLLRSSYKGLAGQRFRLASGTLRLLSVSDVAGAAVDKSLAGAEDAFVLAFSCPLDAVLEAGTHRLSHGELGAFELFVSPVGRPRRDRRYEAVIDRSVTARNPPRRHRRRRRSAGDASHSRMHERTR